MLSYNEFVVTQIVFSKMTSEVNSFIKEANEEEILEHYDNGEDEEWPEETEEIESSPEHRIHENRKAGRKSTWSEEVTNDLVDIIVKMNI